MSAEIEDVAEVTLANPWLAWLAVAIAVAGAVALGLIVSFVFSRVMGALGRKATLFAELRKRFPRALFWIIAIVGCWVSVPRLLPEETGDLAGAIEYVLRLSVIGIVGWIIAKILILFVDGAIRAQDRAKNDPFTVRRRRTQIRMIRRLVIVLVVVLTVGAMLLTIPGAETFGASLLASAGLASIVAGIAAQSTLGNLIAGLQLAFSNALRTGDTVEIDGEYGVVEEITLTYVIVHIWDDRRYVVPSKYFTTTPYMNWTHNQTAVTGTVLFDVDFGTDIGAIRDELELILDGTPLWDRRSWALDVTEAVGGTVQLRASMTAPDADSLWALRSLVREKLVVFIGQKKADAEATTAEATKADAEAE